MPKLFDITEGWTGTLGPFTLRIDGDPLDLTGFTVELVLHDCRGALVNVLGNVTVDADPTTGQVFYTPDAADLNATDSPYTMRWRVTDGANAIIFFPNGAADTLTVAKQ